MQAIELELVSGTTMLTWVDPKVIAGLEEGLHKGFIKAEGTYINLANVCYIRPKNNSQELLQTKG